MESFRLEQRSSERAEAGVIVDDQNGLSVGMVHTAIVPHRSDQRGTASRTFWRFGSKLMQQAHGAAPPAWPHMQRGGGRPRAARDRRRRSRSGRRFEGRKPALAVGHPWAASEARRRDRTHGGAPTRVQAYLSWSQGARWCSGIGDLLLKRARTMEGTAVRL